MKLVSMIFSTLALLSLGINAQNETLASADTVTVSIASATTCYCHLSKSGWIALWRDFSCDYKVENYNVNLNELKFTNDYCTYLYNLRIFKSQDGVGTNWKGKKEGRSDYTGGSSLQWNRDGKVLWWRKQGRIDKGKCNCLNLATSGCPINNKISGCWWDASENE